VRGDTRDVVPPAEHRETRQRPQIRARRAVTS